MSTMWSVIGKTARGDVIDIKPRVDLVSFLDNTRTDISSDVLACNVSRDYKSGLSGSLRVTKARNDGEFWAAHAVNPSLIVETATGVSQVKLGLFSCASLRENDRQVDVGLEDILALHRQPQLSPFSTSPPNQPQFTTALTTTPEAALLKLRELTSSSNIVGRIDHRGFEPTTLLNPNPDVSDTDEIDVRGYPTGSEILCELERLLFSIGWRPPWTSRRGLLTSEPYCSPCDAQARRVARTLPSTVVMSETAHISQNLKAPNRLRVLDSDGASQSRNIPGGAAYSATSIGRVIPHLERARNPASNVDQFWAGLKAPQRTLNFKCFAPGVFWHRDVFKLSLFGLSDAVCVVSRWSLDLISGAYSVSATLCGD